MFVSHLDDKAKARLAVAQGDGGCGRLGADLDEYLSVGLTGRQWSVAVFTDLNHFCRAETPPVKGGDGAGDTFIHDAGFQTMESGQVAPQLGLLLVSGSERGRGMGGKLVRAKLSLLEICAEPCRISHVQGSGCGGLREKRGGVQQ